MNPENPRDYDVHTTLRDGTPIRIRAIRPDDTERLLEHFRGLSEQSKYFRFMGFKRDLTAEDLKRLTELDFKDHVALVATIADDGHERILGVGRYLRGKVPHRAEIAFATLDQHHGRGVATLLLEHLTRIARAGGITEFEADVLRDNRQMLEVFAHSGLKIRETFESGVVHLYFPVREAQNPEKEKDPAKEGRGNPKPGDN
jgi:GNAT superfamily N-acetyltransferase